MADGDRVPGLAAHSVSSLRDVAADRWNALANPAGSPFNPFVSHEFLCALERSNSVGEGTGWTPAHVVLEEDGVAVGAAPLYVKSHSFGEYVFDHHWAEAYERAGGRYYPKLLCATPFTPVPGPRLFAQAKERKERLAAAIVRLGEQRRLSTAHVNFVNDNDGATLAAAGWLPRHGMQFHWFNRGYRSFDEFLATFASRKRKAVNRERREAVDGLVIRRLVGREIDERIWDAFWRFYQDTGDRKWGRPYLTRAFFDEIAVTIPDCILMIVAEDAGRPIAGALHFIGGDCLYGRYWGRIEDRPFLHFEVCYHQAIEFAIERGLARVEAGAQGEHKIARGYEGVATLSAHYVADPGFRAAIADFLERERLGVAADLAAIGDLAPFKMRP